jgi:hypothetical protein
VLANLEMNWKDKPKVSVNRPRGGDPDPDPSTKMVVLQSFDSATYTCAEGYSTDGTTDLAMKRLGVSCLKTGQFSVPGLGQGGECQPVQCDGSSIPSVTRASLTTTRKSIYYFGDSVQLKCNTGTTRNGQGNGATTIDAQCGANGRFPSTRASCKPVTCGSAGARSYSYRSTSGSVQYGQSVTYTCQDGYRVNADSVNGAKTFTATCGADGSFTYSNGGNPQCLPLKCPNLPSMSNTEYISDRKKYLENLKVPCKAGHKCANGADHFYIGCQSSGAYSTPSEKCEASAPVANPSTDVSYNGKVYYFDGSRGVCDPGFSMAPQSVLYSIAHMFQGKTYRHQTSNNCCIMHRDMASEGMDFGFQSSCNANGPFQSGNPKPAGAGCNNIFWSGPSLNAKQLTFCGSD